MSKSVKISLSLIVFAAVALAAVVLLGGEDDGPDPATAKGSEQDDRLARPDSVRLATADDGAPVLVEFLDFECESCRAVKPVVDQVRDDYEGDLEIVVRYMPLHASSVNAAKAAEAADAQGKFDEMYELLFETQPEWGEQQAPEEQFFFDLAEEIGLDMDEFRTVYEDPETTAKVERDQADGEALGVTGTPTFFLDGEQLELTTVDDLLAPLDEAVGR
ncbi:thioredoxin domain-containing protein [Iamia majanohamensis]|uniref:Thioredoxin domain-containing protein n=1 Tax=Iamia majanohamensis TaxID=467976 RepID=A0AAE9Y7I8_9ACTN|nr:thioredoxin domain-containing protein [Iamia majanohamensis]WCO67992.1 thioredoxin domain-containing protein [Iamia majanohamensis]